MMTRFSLIQCASSLMIRRTSVRHFQSSRSVYNKEPSPTIDQLKQELESLKETAKSWEEKCDRVKSDKTVIIRNTEKEFKDATDYGISSFAKQLLNINDTLGLALANTNLESDDPKQEFEVLKEGIDMVNIEFSDVFEKANIVPFTPTVGEKFNKLEHDPVKVQTVVGTETKETVQKVFSNGFKMKDSVIRMSTVEVLRTAPKKEKKEPKATPPSPPATEKKEEKVEEPVDSSSSSSSSSGSSSSESDNNEEKSAEQSDNAQPEETKKE